MRGLALIRVLIVDDHGAIRRGVRSILMSRPDVDICGEAADGNEAINRAVKQRPDLILLDLTMPGIGGFEAAKVLHQLLPEIPIVFYSMHESETLINEAKQVGARGYVSKTDLTDTLLAAVEAVAVRGQTFFPDAPHSVEVVV